MYVRKLLECEKSDDSESEYLKNDRIQYDGIRANFSENNHGKEENNLIDHNEAKKMSFNLCRRFKNTSEAVKKRSSRDREGLPDSNNSFLLEALSRSDSDFEKYFEGLRALTGVVSFTLDEMVIDSELSRNVYDPRQSVTQLSATRLEEWLQMKLVMH